MPRGSPTPACSSPPEMPPKGNPAKPSSSKLKDLVPVGKREVFAKAKPKEKEKVQKPTTSRALVLRNGKYGSQGTGELMLMSKMTGREKLDLLAESLVKDSQKAILNPFRLEKCLKIAESQADVYVDDIAKLRDPELFHHAIEAELRARTDPAREEPRRNPSHVSKVVATRVHNAFMLASAWNIVSHFLNQLAIDGLTDKNVKTKLKTNSEMRDRYLIIYDMVNDLVTVSQDRFAVLATTAPHYAKYFKLKTTEGVSPSESEYVFDWTDLRKAADSFLDSIIIELCFPRGSYPKAILYRILHDAIEESPRDAKRFPQELWNAVGDLSVSIELQELLSAPLFGPEGETWQKQPRQMPEEYEQWSDAQLFSEKASDMSTNFKDIIFPLEKTRKKDVLERMWKQIDENYIAVSGQSIDELWGLEDAFNYEPQWSAFHALANIDEDSEEDDFPRPGPKPKKKPLAITNYSESDSMPELQSVSNTDDEDDDDDDDSDEYSSYDGSSEDDDGYNTEQEDEVRDLLREAMDVAHEADYFDNSTNPPGGIDPFAQDDDRKGNPFLKILGSLRGRMFSSSPKLKTTTRTEPRAAPTRGAFRATPTGAPKPVPKTMPPKAAPPPTPNSPPAAEVPVSVPKSQKATVEDVEDEDDTHLAAAAAKKKKKSKKKKKPATPDLPPGSPSPSVDSVASPSIKSTSPSISQGRTPTTSSQASTTASNVPKVSSGFMSSTTSLPISEVTTAQSSRSYLQSLGLKSEKKVKSRPDHASLFSNTEPKKRSLFSKISGGKDKEAEMKEAKHSWFNKLGKKTTGLMHQLLKTEEDRTDGRSPMKWENFLKLMREMGFEYDPSTAGSSVRFDPPNKNDRPITFHKPHPDPTIQPIMLKEFAKKLKRYYGWNEEDLLRA